MNCRLIWCVGVVLAATLAGCDRNANQNSQPPGLQSTNLQPVTNTDLVNTNLTINSQLSNTNNP